MTHGPRGRDGARRSAAGRIKQAIPGRAAPRQRRAAVGHTGGAHAAAFDQAWCEYVGNADLAAEGNAFISRSATRGLRELRYRVTIRFLTRTGGELAPALDVWRSWASATARRIDARMANIGEIGLITGDSVGGGAHRAGVRR
jgi:hypothetical protein